MPQLKELSLALAKPWLRKAQPLTRPIGREEAQSILVYRPERIGDVFVSLPLIDALRSWHPSAKISIVVSPASLPLVAQDPRFHEVIGFDKSAQAVFRLRKRMRSRRYDVVIDLVCDDSVSALLYSHLFTSANYYLGMGKSRYAEYYHRVVPYRSRPPRHVIDHTLALCESFGIRGASPYSRPHVPQAEADHAEAWFDALRQKGRENLIGINLSAGSESRRWPDTQILKLIGLMNQDPHTATVLICTPADRHVVRPLVAAAGQNVHLVPDGLSFLAASAYIAQLSLLVSPDTSLIHIARSFGVPVVGLYTRFMDNYQIWYPYGQPEGVVLSAGTDNIHDITAERVYTTATRLLSQKVPQS